MREDHRRIRGLHISIGVLISALFLVLALRGVDLGRAWEVVRSADPAMLAAALAGLALIFAFKSFRWRYQLATMQTVGLGNSFSAALLGYTANVVLPLRGGDLVRAHVLARREGVGTGTTLSTIVLERFFDAAAVLTAALVVLLTVPLPGWMRVPLLFVGGAGIAGFLAVVVLHRLPDSAARGWNALLRRTPGRLGQLATAAALQLRLGLATARGTKRLLVQYLFALGEWTLWGLVTYATLRAAGIHLPAPAVMATVIATNLAVALPAAPAGIGVFEFAVMAALVFYDVGRSTALGSALLLHVLFMGPACLAGLLLYARGWLGSAGSSAPALPVTEPEPHVTTGRDAHRRPD